jgi:hypothetical protein
MAQNRVNISELETILAKETAYPWDISFEIMVKDYETSNCDSNL